MGLLAITGSQHLLRRRCYYETLTKYHSGGYRLDFVDGNNSMNVRAALSGNVLFSEKCLVVVENPEAVDVSLWIEQDKVDDNMVVLLYYEGTPKGNTKFGKFVAGLKKTQHASFVFSDKPWEQDSEALSFCIKEFKRYGKTLDEKLAGALVKLLGSDFGFLSFEIQKIAMLADIDKAEIITIEYIKQGVSFTPQVMSSSVVDAIATKDRKKVSTALNRVKTASKDDPTMMLCRVVGSSAFKWLAVLDMKQKGVRLDEGAGLIGVNSWYLQNKIAPQVANWSWEDAKKLIKILSDTERSVLNGQLEPWVYFCSRILGFCEGGLV
jgi:DNA polymerase III delta subunit